MPPDNSHRNSRKPNSTNGNTLARTRRGTTPTGSHTSTSAFHFSYLRTAQPTSPSGDATTGYIHTNNDAARTPILCRLLARQGWWRTHRSSGHRCCRTSRSRTAGERGTPRASATSSNEPQGNEVRINTTFELWADKRILLQRQNQNEMYK